MANCPRCGGSLNGYVELGSTGYNRVKSGCCPNCGAGMPANMSVGFKEAVDTNPRVYGSVVADSREKGRKYKYWSLYFPVLGGVGIYLIGNVWWVTLIGVILALLFSFSLCVYCSGLTDRWDLNGNYRQSDIKNLSLFWIVSIVSIILFLVGIMVAVDRNGFVSFFWLLSIVADFVFASLYYLILKITCFID